LGNDGMNGGQGFKATDEDISHHGKAGRVSSGGVQRERAQAKGEHERWLDEAHAETHQCDATVWAPRAFWRHSISKNANEEGRVDDPGRSEPVHINDLPRRRKPYTVAPALVSQSGADSDQGQRAPASVVQMRAGA